MRRLDRLRPSRVANQDSVGALRRRLRKRCAAAPFRPARNYRLRGQGASKGRRNLAASDRVRLVSFPVSILAAGISYARTGRNAWLEAVVPQILQRTLDGVNLPL